MYYILLEKRRGTRLWSRYVCWGGPDPSNRPNQFGGADMTVIRMLLQLLRGMIAVEGWPASKLNGLYSVIN